MPVNPRLNYVIYCKRTKNLLKSKYTCYGIMKALHGFLVLNQLNVISFVKLRARISS